MPDLTITPAAVVPSPEARERYGIAAEAIARGQPIYRTAAGAIYLSQALGTEAQATVDGIALNDAAAGQRVDYAALDEDFQPGAPLVPGALYVLSLAPGAIKPLGELADGEYVTAIYAGKANGRAILKIVSSGVRAGGWLTLSASGLVTATVSADLGVYLALSASGTCTATGSADLALLIALSASVTCTATAAAALTAYLALTAPGTVTATASADLDVALTYPAAFSAWTHRVPIEIDSSQITSDLTNYVGYVPLADMPAGFWDADYSASIRVTTSDGETEIPFDIAAYDSGGETGELYYRYPGTLSSSADTTIYIYYDNGAASAYSASDTYGSQNVWQDYGVVLHMEEDPSGTAPQVLDSTANANHGTSEGTMTTGDLVAGALGGKGLDFDETDDRLSIPDDASLDLPDADWAISFHAYLPDLTGSGTQYVVSRGAIGTLPSINIWFNEVSASPPSYFARRIRGADGDTGIDSSPMGSPVGSWTYFSVYRIGTNLYQNVNGTETQFDTTDVGAIAPSSALYVGGREDASSTRYFGGIIDEFRINTTGLSSAQIAAEYLNQSAPNTFHTIGSEQVES